MARRSAFRRRRRTGTRKGGRRRVHFSRKARSRTNRRRPGGRKSRGGRRRSFRGGGLFDLFGLFGNHYDDERRMRAYEALPFTGMGSGRDYVNAFNAARNMGRGMLDSAGDFFGRLRDSMTGMFNPDGSRMFTPGVTDRVMDMARGYVPDMSSDYPPVMGTDMPSDYGVQDPEFL